MNLGQPWVPIVPVENCSISLRSGRMSTLGANRTRRDGRNDVNDPNVWSGRAEQEDFDKLVVSGLA